MRAVFILAIIGLAALACSAPAANTATPTVAAATSTATAVAVVTTSPAAATVAPVVTPASTPTAAGTPRDVIATTGKTVSVDQANQRATLFIPLAQNPAVSNQNVTFRFDANTKMTILQKGGPGKNVATFAELDLQVNEAAALGFLVSSYDPATKTYLLGLIQRTPGAQ